MLIRIVDDKCRKRPLPSGGVVLAIFTQIVPSIIGDAGRRHAAIVHQGGYP
jgi:hypothetical protein